MIEELKKALDEQFPSAKLKVMVFDLNNQLGVAFYGKDGVKRAVCSPQGIRWQNQSKEYWLHRFSQQLREFLE